MSGSLEVGLKISTIGMLIVAARRSIRQLVAAKVVPLDLTPHHAWMLMVIAKAAPLSQTNLAKAMWMDPPTVSRLIFEMEARGYLSVEPDPAHGRRNLISLTSEGLALFENLDEIRANFEEGSQKGMTEEEVAALREGLVKFMSNLDVMVAAELGGVPLRPRHGQSKSEASNEITGT